MRVIIGLGMAITLPLAFGGTVRGQIVGTTGAVVVVTNPPAKVFSNQWENNTQIRAFAEQQAIVLPQDVSADITVPGTSPSATDSNLSPAVIPAGTAVSSFYVHYDVVGQPSTPLAANGSITFGEDVLGILVTGTPIDATDSFLGLSGVDYGNGTHHGLELNPAGGGTSDVLTLSADRRTITVDLLCSTQLDDFRVITAVPEPGSLVLVGIAVAGAAGPTTRRRRR